MIPVRTRASNFVYRGPTPDVGDAWCERVPAEGAVYLDWQPSDEERELIAGGGLIRLGIYGMEPIPPVSLNVSTARPISEAGAAWRDRARQSPPLANGVHRMPSGYWTVSPDVWESLQLEGALDEGIEDTVPLLWGRPLLESEDVPVDTLSFIQAGDAS